MLDSRLAINSRAGTEHSNLLVGPVRPRLVVPPHQGSGAGIAIEGEAWASGWYPAATELNILKKAYSSPKQLVSF